MADLLPPNATTLERNLAATNAVIDTLPVPLRDLMNPDTCPVSLLPWLAAYLSVDSWDLTWNESQKRETIKASLGVHRIKGTAGAVKRAMAALGFDVQLQEWFNQIPKGEPYTFQLLLNVDQVGFDKTKLLRLLEVVAGTKNLRSHLSRVVPQVITTAALKAAAATSVGHEITTDSFEYTLIADGSVEADGSYRANGIKLKS